MKRPQRRLDARAVALQALLEGGDSAIGLDRSLGAADLSERDRSFATTLAYGTLKMQRALAWSLERFLARPFATLDARLRWVLLMGAYQLLYLHRVPAHSAVDESVRLARAHGHSGTAGLANAVLRRVASEKPMPPVPAEGSGPSALGTYASLPDWIARHLIERFGFARALEAARGLNGSPRHALRVDGRSEKAPTDVLAEAGIAAHAGRYGIPECAVLEEACDMAAVRKAVASGVAAWQSEESQLAVHILAPVAGETVLDACCGRGVKSMMIAGRLRGSATLWCVDDDERKLVQLRQAAERLHLADRLQVACVDARRPYPEIVAAGVDAALVDAPCSGIGIVGRRADARWRKREGDPARFASVQRAVLAAAAERVRAGGRLLYVTCSTHPLENEIVVDGFLRDNSSWTARPLELEHTQPAGAYRLSIPGIDGSDGFFYALLERQRT